MKKEYPNFDSSNEEGPVDRILPIEHLLKQLSDLKRLQDEDIRKHKEKMRKENLNGHGNVKPLLRIKRLKDQTFEEMKKSARKAA